MNISRVITSWWWYVQYHITVTEPHWNRCRVVVSAAFCCCRSWPAWRRTRRTHPPSVSCSFAAPLQDLQHCHLSTLSSDRRTRIKSIKDASVHFTHQHLDRPQYILCAMTSKVEDDSPNCVPQGSWAELNHCTGLLVCFLLSYSNTRYLYLLEEDLHVSWILYWFIVLPHFALKAFSYLGDICKSCKFNTSQVRWSSGHVIVLI